MIAQLDTMCALMPIMPENSAEITTKRAAAPAPGRRSRGRAAAARPRPRPRSAPAPSERSSPACVLPSFAARIRMGSVCQLLLMYLVVGLAADPDRCCKEQARATTVRGRARTHGVVAPVPRTACRTHKRHCTAESCEMCKGVPASHSRGTRVPAAATPRPRPARSPRQPPLRGAAASAACPATAPPGMLSQAQSHLSQTLMLTPCLRPPDRKSVV